MKATNLYNKFTMSDLFKKLNTLMRASINDALDEAGNAARRLPLGRRGNAREQLEREVETLRARINEAIEYEDELQARVASLQAQVTRLDQQADEAVMAGRDAQARHLIDQMQRVQQQLTIAQSDLASHQLVAQDLIRQVNLLEATVGDLQRQQDTSPPPADTDDIPTRSESLQDQDEVESTDADDDDARVNVLTDMIRNARASIANQPKRPASETLANEPSTSNEKSISDDLEVRRQRLSKK